jgi:Family of unknown function (DUF6159)
MFSRIGYTWSLMKASWDVLRRTKGLIVFPILSAVCCLMVLATFLVPLFITGAWRPPEAHAELQHKLAYYATLFAFYFCNYLVITYFNAAIISGAVARLTGSEATVGSCLREATKRIHLIIGWALVSATVGMVLRVIEDRSPKVGQFVAGLLGAVWSIVSFLVVPALVVDNLGPLAALKESGRLLKKTWGDQLIGNFSFGLVFFLLMLPLLALAGFGAYALAAMHSVPLGAACLGVAVIGLIVLGLVQATLQTIFQAAVYLHTKGVHDHGFPADLMAEAMRVKA